EGAQEGRQGEDDEELQEPEPREGEAHLGAEPGELAPGHEQRDALHEARDQGEPQAQPYPRRTARPRAGTQSRRRGCLRPRFGHWVRVLHRDSVPHLRPIRSWSGWPSGVAHPPTDATGAPGPRATQDKPEQPGTIQSTRAVQRDTRAGRRRAPTRGRLPGRPKCAGRYAERGQRGRAVGPAVGTALRKKFS